MSPLLLAASACPSLVGQGPSARVDPPVFDFGPLTTGSACTATLSLINDGRADLKVTNTRLAEQNGQFTISFVPRIVTLGAKEALRIDYVAGSEVDTHQSATVVIATNDAAHPTVSGRVTALVVDGPRPLAKPSCDDTQAPCDVLEFGTVPVGNPALPVTERVGAKHTVTIHNDGTAPLTVNQPSLDGSSGAFALLGARVDGTVVPFPVTLKPGRTTDCGAASTESGTDVVIDLWFAPTAAGRADDALVVESDSVEDASYRLPLHGAGAAIGIALEPTVALFSPVTVEQTHTVDVRITNQGSGPATINEACISLDGATCTAPCTGGADDKALDGALACEILTAAGAHEGKGFVLAPLDGNEGGADERVLHLTFTPGPRTTIPASAAITLRSNILANKVFRVPVGAGPHGVLAVRADPACGASQCLHEIGDSTDVKSLGGALALTLDNSGDANLDVSRLALETSAGKPVDDATANDFTWQRGDESALDPAAPAVSIAAGATTTLRLVYKNDDAILETDLVVVITHTGLGNETRVPVVFIPPPR